MTMTAYAEQQKTIENVTKRLTILLAQELYVASALHTFIKIESKHPLFESSYKAFREKILAGMPFETLSDEMQKDLIQIARKINYEYGNAIN